MAKRILVELRRQAARPWCRARPHLFGERALLRITGASSVDALWTTLAAAPFFVGPARQSEWSRRFLAAFPGAKGELVEAAEAVLAHRFDLLGSGPVTLGPRLPWHEDFKTGRRWPRRYCHTIEYNELDRPSDVKVPWELSRCQHFTLLGQAYWLTGDERFAREFVDEVTDWIEANPFAYGVNWACPMDVALRAIGWIWGFYFLAGAAACGDSTFRSRFLRALFLHGEFVAKNLELSDVNGNHYLVDALGLLVVGSFFQQTGKGARWLAKGERIMIEEVVAQVTEDGVDFEQSIAYHRLALEAFLTSLLLLRLHGRRPAEALTTRVERMLEFVAAYTKPDGRVPLIGDADDGRIQKLGLQPVGDHRYLLAAGAALFGRGDFKAAASRFWQESFWYLGPGGLDAFEQLATPPAPSASVSFPAGGFYVMRGPGAHLIVDCAEVGMRGRGVHGHSDVLSFELYLDGANLVTDCGAYLYTASREWRNRFRSTAFHNVVQVDDEEINRLVHPDELFRLRDDAQPRDVVWRPSDTVDYFCASHSGYERLSPPVSSRREIALDKRTGLVVFRDHLAGKGRRRLVWRFHLDPAVSAHAVERDVRLMAAGRTAWLALVDEPDDLATHLDDGWVSPRYGVKVPATVVVFERVCALPATLAYVFAPERLSPEKRRAALGALEPVR